MGSFDGLDLRESLHLRYTRGHLTHSCSSLSTPRYPSVIHKEHEALCKVGSSVFEQQKSPFTFCICKRFFSGFFVLSTLFKCAYQAFQKYIYIYMYIYIFEFSVMPHYRDLHITIAGNWLAEATYPRRYPQINVCRVQHTSHCLCNASLTSRNEINRLQYSVLSASIAVRSNYDNLASGAQDLYYALRESQRVKKRGEEVKRGRGFDNSRR